MATSAKVTSSTVNNQTSLEIWEVILNNSSIKFFKPLLVVPTLLDQGTPGECYFAECPEIGLSAVGVDLEELSSCLRSDIRMTWKRIVQTHDNELSSHDRNIKRRFLELAEEIHDG